MPTTDFAFDWSDLAFGSKSKLNKLNVVFIPAPRTVSDARLTELVKDYLPKGNILLGVAKEEFVQGLEDEPQFRTLTMSSALKLAVKVNSAKLPHKIYLLSYFQRELPYILENIVTKNVVLVRGSWKYAFHTRPEYYTLIKRNIPYTIVSPFVDEAEARRYERGIIFKFAEMLPKPSELLSEHRMLDLAKKIGTASYDYSFQTGAVLGKRGEPKSPKYQLVSFGFNKVVPFQTYALHYGASREEHFSPPHDLNHYDTIHAEVKLILNAAREGTDLRGTTMFINLMPCPTCSRMIADTDIEEIVYTIDHSDGYAVRMLEEAGKKVRRVVPPMQPEV